MSDITKHLSLYRTQTFHKLRYKEIFCKQTPFPIGLHYKMRPLSIEKKKKELAHGTKHLWQGKNLEGEQFQKDCKETKSISS